MNSQPFDRVNKEAAYVPRQVSGCHLAVAVMWQKHRRYKFKIKTRAGSFIGTTVEGRGVYEVEAKLKRQYPGCTILRAEEL